ncbi:type II secretion system F family protein [Candidatus Poriferisodalis sp.]|uniref:type II secretion system F family protein n=1 Tax=Candidatus Poriferisodalis sp. TaxID=3101277 RepID=UPI003B51DDA9
MTQVIALAVSASVGVMLMIVGMFRRRRPLQLPGVDAQAAGVRGATKRATGRLQKDLERKQHLGQDATMVGRTLESHALAKLGGFVGGAVVMIVGVMLLSLAFGLSIPLLMTLTSAAGGALLGWWLPDSMLKTEAENERVRFKESSEAWLELVAQLVTAGSDAHAALHIASGYSSQPAFAAIRESLVEASAMGEAPWLGLRRLAASRRLRFMDPFIAALELAGTTGAGARQSILSQVDAARSKSLAEADAKAASASEKMGAPLALIGGAFMMLMGYPPLASIMDSSTIPTGF